MDTSMTYRGSVMNKIIFLLVVVVLGVSCGTKVTERKRKNKDKIKVIMEGFKGDTNNVSVEEHRVDESIAECSVNKIAEMRAEAIRARFDEFENKSFSIVEMYLEKNINNDSFLIRLEGEETKILCDKTKEMIHKDYVIVPNSIYFYKKKVKMYTVQKHVFYHLDPKGKINKLYSDYLAPDELDKNHLTSGANEYYWYRGNLLIISKRAVEVVAYVFLPEGN